MKPDPGIESARRLLCALRSGASLQWAEGNTARHEVAIAFETIDKIATRRAAQSSHGPKGMQGG